jgi:hypothetical protein
MATRNPIAATPADVTDPYAPVPRRSVSAQALAKHDAWLASLPTHMREILDKLDEPYDRHHRPPK